MPHVSPIARLIRYSLQAHTLHTYTPHIYIHTWLATQVTQRTHMNTDSTNGLIPLPSLAEQDNGQLVGGKK